MRCHYLGCLYDTDEDIPTTSSVSEKQMQLAMHVAGHHTSVAAQPAPVQQHTERIQKPKLTVTDGQVTEEDWEYFVHAWWE